MVQDDGGSSIALGRLQKLQGHFGVLDSVSPAGTYGSEARPAPGGGRGSLSVTDSRTGKSYQMQISDGGTVKASEFKQIKAGGDNQGLRIYDNGYTNVSAVKSSISYIDGDKGILRYRGYPIEELADKSTYLETAYLLQYGHLPSTEQLEGWESAIMRHTEIPLQVMHCLEALPMDAHPMGVLLTGISALGTLHPEANPAISGQGVYDSQEIRDKQAVRIIAKMANLAAYAYHRKTGRMPAPPTQKLTYAENFLYMLDAGNDPNYKPHPRLARALDIMFILHADHEMNCSTAAARHLASSGVDVYTAVAGAVGALYGPLHGGANEAVLRMLHRIGSVENIPAFIAGVKAKKEKLFGFGHRVYKNFDPRATLIKKVAEEVFSIVGRDPLIDIATALQDIALKDEYFVSRKLYPNVDFYSGLVYRAMGFPMDFFTVLFAIPRAAGYLSHWRESLDDPDTKIIRPQQDYQGVWLRHYEGLQSRSDSAGPTMVPLVPSNAYRRRVAGNTV